MKELIVAFALLLTIALSLGLGVILGFAAIAGILNSFGRRSTATAKPAPALASGSSSGGD